MSIECIIKLQYPLIYSLILMNLSIDNQAHLYINEDFVIRTLKVHLHQVSIQRR
jgi:hypothetical protein